MLRLDAAETTAEAILLVGKVSDKLQVVRVVSI